MSELIKEKIKEVKEQREKYLEKYKKYFEDEDLTDGHSCWNSVRLLKKDFRDYIIESEIFGKKSKRRKKLLDKKLYRLRYENVYFYFTSDTCWKDNRVSNQTAEGWKIIKSLFSMIEKYAEPYKTELAERELRRLRDEYGRLTNAKKTCDCCNEELRDDAKYCHKCGTEWGKKGSVCKTCKLVSECKNNYKDFVGFCYKYQSTKKSANSIPTRNNEGICKDCKYNIGQAAGFGIARDNVLISCSKRDLWVDPEPISSCSVWEKDV